MKRRELYYFNARWYDAELGRFISKDPIKDGLNWYVYCGNNPLVFVDATGLSGEKDPESYGYLRNSNKKGITCPLPNSDHNCSQIKFHDLGQI